MDKLIIVESPTKARTLARFLGSDYRIEATMGHIRDLPQKRLGIDVDHDFKPLYQVIPGRGKKIKELKDAASLANLIILATDPDREGEAIAYHVMQVISPTKERREKFQRIVFHEITEEAIKSALTNPHSIDMQLVSAQQARRVLDRLVGYKLSPLLWNKLGKNWLSAGRVQSVAVRLIVEREREIQNFKPEEYWLVEVELEKLAKSDQAPAVSFLAKLIQIGDKKADVRNKETADKVVEHLKKSTYKVKSIEIKDVRRYPSPPFTTSTLQQAAANRLYWSSKRTMQTAQKLYEEGFITYHRTDSTNLSSMSLDMVRTYINNVYGPAYLPANPKLYKTKSKVAQEAHEAIRPTNVNENLQTVTDKLGREAERLYFLIWQRFVGSQMNEALFLQQTADIDATNSESYILRANGQKLKFDGFLKVYGKSALGENSADDGRELPTLVTNEPLKLKGVLPQQKFTEPPPRYNEASLIKILEEKGIGRPSTYAPIISTILDRKYVERIDRKFHPTDLGFSVNDFLIKYFPDIFDVFFTAKMEDELDEVANGKMEWIPVIHEFYDPLSIRIKKVYEEAEKVKVDLGKTNEKCEKCGSPMVIRMSKYGKFLACSKFPECKFTKNILEKAGITCPECGGEIIVRKTRRGKQFYGCSNYPKCKFAAWKKEEIIRSTTSSKSTMSITS